MKTTFWQTVKDASKLGFGAWLDPLTAVDRALPRNAADLFFEICPGRGMRQVHESPNIFEIDNFLTETELQHIGRIVAAKFANNGGFKKSTVNTEVDAILGVEDENRTSTTMWLNKQQDAITRQIETRAAGLLGYAATHCEPLQIVHYTEGQFFDTHHDAGTLMEDGSVEALPPRTHRVLPYMDT
jgi:hypothetical protein